MLHMCRDVCLLCIYIHIYLCMHMYVCIAIARVYGWCSCCTLLHERFHVMCRGCLVCDICLCFRVPAYVVHCNPNPYALYGMVFCRVHDSGSVCASQCPCCASLSKCLVFNQLFSIVISPPSICCAYMCMIDMSRQRDQRPFPSLCSGPLRGQSPAQGRRRWGRAR